MPTAYKSFRSGYCVLRFLSILRIMQPDLQWLLGLPRVQRLLLHPLAAISSAAAVETISESTTTSVSLSFAAGAPGPTTHATPGHPT